MSQHDTSPREADPATPAVDAGDGSPVADAPEPRPSRRGLLVWLAVPAVIAVGAGGGYLAAEAWTPANRPPAVTAVGHSSHAETAPQTHEGAQVPSEHGAHTPTTDDQYPADQHEQHQVGAGHDAASAPATTEGGTGHDAGGGHESSSGRNEPTAVSRPRTAVLTGFAVVNAAILLAAIVLRRRRPRPARRAAAVGTA